MPCEQVFSSAKETMTDRRNNIHAELMEMLQMLKFTLKSGRSIDFMQGTSREAVMEFVISTMEEEIVVPEDINAYVQSLMLAVA